MIRVYFLQYSERPLSTFYITENRRTLLQKLNFTLCVTTAAVRAKTIPVNFYNYAHLGTDISTGYLI